MLMTEEETYNFHYETFCQDDYYDYYDYYDEEVRAMESEDDREPKMLMTEKETDNFHYETFCQQDYYVQSKLFKSSHKLEFERKIAQEIINVVHKLQLPLKLDELTRGEGDCFPLAVLQQCQRAEIFSYIRPSIKRFVSGEDGHSVLRREVTKFIKKSKTQRIAEFRANFEETDGASNKESWDEYWERMETNKTWVDFWFIQATAWYLQLDIWIITTSSTNRSPYIEISGDLENGGIPFDRPIVILGTKSNCHYQSLLLDDMLSHQHFMDQEKSDVQMNKDGKKFNGMADPASFLNRRSEKGSKICNDSMQLDLPTQGKRANNKLLK